MKPRVAECWRSNNPGSYRAKKRAQRGAGAPSTDADMFSRMDDQTLDKTIDSLQLAFIRYSLLGDSPPSRYLDRTRELLDTAYLIRLDRSDMVDNQDG